MAEVINLGIEPVIRCPDCDSLKFYLIVDFLGSNASKITGFECVDCGLRRYFELKLEDIKSD